MNNAWQSLAVALIATPLLLWNLGGQTLWQDEAATAVLAQRMLEYGRPLAYDGRNLITMDYDSPETAEELAQRTSSAEGCIRYYAQRGDFKPDTTWTGHPWGQFVLAAGSFQLFGVGTWQARLPFALCGALTVVVLFHFVRRRFGTTTAWLAVALLLGNVYWMLHARQCRYYAVSPLLLLLVVVAYWRWQDGAKWARAGFVLCAWLLFQFDYGVFVPALALLLAAACWTARRPRIETLALAGAVALAVLPWVFYYQLGGRLKETSTPFWIRLLGLTFNVNQFVIPLVVLAGAAVAAWFDRRGDTATATSHRRVVWLGCGLIATVVVWMAYVAPFPFQRYVVSLTPIAAWLAAYAVVAAAVGVCRLCSQPGCKIPLSVAAATVLIATPWLALPLSWLVPVDYRTAKRLDLVWRREFRRLTDDYLGLAPDSTRDLLAAIEVVAGPDDELVVNAEDIPLMFYTDRRVRGGFPGFRAKELSDGSYILVIRRLGGGAAGQALLDAAAERYWQVLPAQVPDIPMVNCPDPFLNYLDRTAPRDLVIARPAGKFEKSTPAP